MHAVLLLFRPLPNVGIQNFSMWGMYDLSKAYRSMQKSIAIAESRTGKPAMVTLKIQPDCSTVHDTFLWSNIYVRSHLGCGTDSVSSVFRRSHKYFTDAKVMQMNRVLKIKKIKFDRSCSINPQNNRDLKQGIYHLWFKFGGPSLNGWWVIARTSSKWGKFWLWS